MSRKSNLDKFQSVMFDDMSSLEHLNKTERDQVLRYRFAFAVCLDNPSIPDIELRDKIINEFGIARSQAYLDISNIKVILPNIRNAGKEWIRYIVNEELKDAIARCKLGGDNMMKERIAAIDKLAKYNKLDQDDKEEMPWDDIIPVGIEPTSDPTVLGITPMKNKDEEILRLIEKYKGEIEIEDIEYQDISEQDGTGT
jgi:hypothetical protein